MNISPFASRLTTYGFHDPFRIRRGELSAPVCRVIKRKEEELHRKCGQIWFFRNPVGEDFIFARFNKGRKDNIIVTLASYLPHIGWVPQH